MIVSGKRVAIEDAAREGRNRTLEVLVTDTCKRWAVMYPEEVAAFSRQMAMERRELVNSNGMTRRKTMMAKNKVPAKLYWMLVRVTHREWREDPQINRIFRSVFKIGNLNRTSET